MQDWETLKNRTWSSGNLLLLVLSLYFSWICPAETSTLALPSTALIVEKSAVSGSLVFAAVSPKKNIKYAPLELKRFLPYWPGSISIKQQKFQEDLLPAPDCMVQLKTHRPRGAFALS